MSALRSIGGGFQPTPAEPILDLVSREVQRATFSHTAADGQVYVYDLPLYGDFGVMQNVLYDQLGERLNRLIAARTSRNVLADAMTLAMLQGQLDAGEITQAEYDKAAIIEAGMLTPAEALQWESYVSQRAELIVTATPAYLHAMPTTVFATLSPGQKWRLLQAFQEAGLGVAVVLARRQAEQAAKAAAETMTEPTPMPTTTKPKRARAKGRTGAPSSPGSDASTAGVSESGHGTHP